MEVRGFSSYTNFRTKLIIMLDWNVIFAFLIKDRNFKAYGICAGYHAASTNCSCSTPFLGEPTSLDSNLL